MYYVVKIHCKKSLLCNVTVILCLSYQLDSISCCYLRFE